VLGNNGIGTALKVGKPVFIYGIEHYVEQYKSWSCLGIPIKQDGNIIGALDVSVLNKYAHPSRMATATACVNSIENEIANVKSKDVNIKHEQKMMATSDLIATAVHDLKNPLAVIRGLGDLGNLLSTSVKEQSYYTRIIDQVQTLNNIIMDLLDIFKPQTPLKCSPSLVINSILQEIEPICSLNKIDIDLQMQSIKEVDLYDIQFKRSMQNLVDNSIKAMPDGGRIVVRTEDRDGHILISIGDTGLGIPADIEGDLFQSYVFRSEGGTGLGLFMAHHVITELHSGQIWFESEVGKGTTFFISIPCKENETIVG